ncbi:hypothetical protein [Sphaerisporangium fuscum]|uniref:hypothetical protein n=1 Tax=Sphaerisporangium fuscum TaxID=2835868 RepID=UPI001BDC12D6|nr:hypothetical protein [Sphaerisporangium fuscum]
MTNRRHIAALAVAAGLLAGCGVARGATAAPPAATPGTVEQISAKTGCAEPQIQVQATELRQGMCRTAAGQYSVTTFATDQGQKEWLDDALSYGGAYLVGARWIVLGNTREMLEPFRAKLGGTITMGHTMPMPEGQPTSPGHPMPEGHPMDHGQMPAGHSMPSGEHAMP